MKENLGTYFQLYFVVFNCSPYRNMTLESSSPGKKIHNTTTQPEERNSTVFILEDYISLTSNFIPLTGVVLPFQYSMEDVSFYTPKNLLY